MILRKLCLLSLLLLGNAAFADVIKTIQIGATDQTVTMKVIDSATGVPSTDLAFNSSGIDLQYWRHGANSAVAITEATQTVSGAHSDGGFVHVGAGQYRLDLPDAAVASGATAVEVFGLITGEIVIGGTVQLVAYNPHDAVRLGLTALPNANADAAGGLVISDAGGLNIDATAASVTAIEVDTSTTLDNLVDDLESRLGTPSDFGSGTSTIAANLQDLADNGTATFDRSTDSLQAIRDRGDAEWVTGGGGSCPSDVVCTTVATAPTTTSITATAAPNSDTQLDGWGLLFTDNGDADSYCLRQITGVSSGTITYDSACPFTVAASDEVAFLPAFLDSGVNVTQWLGTAVATPTTAGVPEVDVTFVSGTAQTANDNGADINAILLDTAEIGTAGAGLTNINLPNQTMDITGSLSGSVGSVTGAVGSVTGAVGSVTGNVGGIAGALNTFDDLDTAQDTQHGTTQSAVAALNDLSSADVQSAATTAINATLEQHVALDPMWLNCEVNTANFAGSTTTLACILTDRDGGAVTRASGDLTGLGIVVLSGAEQREQRFINSTTWDAGNSELQLTLSRALPGVLADAVSVLIR